MMVKLWFNGALLLVKWSLNGAFFCWWNDDLMVLYWWSRNAWWFMMGWILLELLMVPLWSLEKTCVLCFWCTMNRGEVRKCMEMHMLFVMRIVMGHIHNPWECWMQCLYRVARYSLLFFLGIDVWCFFFLNPIIHPVVEGSLKTSTIIKNSCHFVVHARVAVGIRPYNFCYFSRCHKMSNESKMSLDLSMLLG